MELTFEELPKVIGLLAVKLDKIEQLLLKKDTPIKEEEEILNLDEACKLLNLAKPTVYGLVSQRKVPFMKQGKKLYFSKPELTKWLKEGSKAVKEETTAVVDRVLSGARRKGR